MKFYNFNTHGWLTPNTYGKNFAYPPKKSGVYLIVLPDVSGEDDKILYVGCAKNLNNRWSGHEVLRILGQVYGYVQFYFKETKEYLQEEAFLIKLIQPKFNQRGL